MREVEYGRSGVHSDVAEEHAVEHARLLEGADQGQTSFVVGEADAVDEDGHVARRRVLGIGDTEQQRRLVQVHDALYWVVVHLVAKDAVDDSDVTRGRTVGHRHVDSSVHRGSHRRISDHRAVDKPEVDRCASDDRHLH